MPIPWHVHDYGRNVRDSRKSAQSCGRQFLDGRKRALNHGRIGPGRLEISRDGTGIAQTGSRPVKHLENMSQSRPEPGHPAGRRDVPSQLPSLVEADSDADNSTVAKCKAKSDTNNSTVAACHVNSDTDNSNRKSR
jgi:hypothetical protein